MFGTYTIYLHTMEVEILNIAVEKINEIVGIECRILENGLVESESMNAELAIKQGGKENRYYAEIKKKVVPNNIARILEQAKKLEQLVIIADYITPKAKGLLKVNNVSYVDTAGNMFLQNKNIYVLIQTDNTNRQKIKSNTKAFNKAGLKVIYQFLINPEYINKPYRFIGAKAKVTIATVGVVLKDLLRENYIVKANEKEYKYQNREKLFEEWVREYNNKLRPKLRTRRYKWLNKDQNWRKIELPDGAFWGGSNAAEILTKYLISNKIEIYTGLSFEEVMKSLKLLPYEKGEITVTEIFWSDNKQKEKIVDPFLIYADLLNDSSARSLEAANIIFKEYVEAKL